MGLPTQRWACGSRPGGAQVACVQGLFSILAFEIFSACICPRSQARSPVFPSQRYGVSSLHPACEDPWHPQLQPAPSDRPLLHIPNTSLKQRTGRAPWPGTETPTLPTPAPEVKPGGQAGKSFSSFPQIFPCLPFAPILEDGPALIPWPWWSWLALPQYAPPNCLLWS